MKFNYKCKSYKLQHEKNTTNKFILLDYYEIKPYTLRTSLRTIL